MLEISNLNISHDHLQVVWDLSISVKEGEIVTLIGPNGSGKTTTVETIAGLNNKASGTILFLGKDILGMPPHQIFKNGLALVPERREIFPKMAVFENLQLGSAGKEDVMEKMLDLVYSLFPVLHEREKQQAGTMSGGEQQMLAIARALMSDPKLLVLDEPSTGLSPLLVAQVFRSLEQLGRGGLTILLLEQNVRNALDLCNRGYVLENGRIVLEGRSKELMHHPHIQKAYLGF
ncbi:MAG: ABC transporter ATP-binding protein [Methanoregula sp.]|nr:ABC transporter ATP-binding protein [Methanoregula sp.]